MPILSQSKSYYWTSMSILSHYNSYWTSMPIISQSEKLLYVLLHPAGLLSWKNSDYLDFWNIPIFKMYNIIFPDSEQLFQKWLPRANHYAHETRSEILSRTPVSILKYLSPRPQNLRRTFNNNSRIFLKIILVLKQP